MWVRNPLSMVRVDINEGEVVAVIELSTQVIFFFHLLSKHWGQ